MDQQVWAGQAGPWARTSKNRQAWAWGKAHRRVGHRFLSPSDWAGQVGHQFLTGRPGMGLAKYPWARPIAIPTLNPQNTIILFSPNSICARDINQPSMAAIAASSTTPRPPSDLISSSYSDDDDNNSTTTSDSDTSVAPSQPRGRSSAVESSILSTYLNASGEALSSTSLSNLIPFLSSASGRGGPHSSCLICLSRIRLSDPVWSCTSSCFSLFHLPCIQSWSLQPLHSSNSSIPSSSTWSCPKCRFAYPRSLVPRSYRCFCGKLEDPPLDPWLLPHSCGEICDRPLGVPHPDSTCGHNCLLLCHPGPCPPCPQLVLGAQCFCGSHKEARRCAHKHFSCGRSCNKPLTCGMHRCQETCHQGECPPCKVKGNYTCECGKVREERVCSEHKFRCENPCDGVHACSKHKCERGCHAGPCGDCPRQGKRTCPCGKQEHKELGCDVESPTCGATCGKLLRCGQHKCPERCHRGPCVETCRIMVVKFCRCGGSKKEVRLLKFGFQIHLAPHVTQSAD